MLLKDIFNIITAIAWTVTASEYGIYQSNVTECTVPAREYGICQAAAQYIYCTLINHFSIDLTVLYVSTVLWYLTFINVF